MNTYVGNVMVARMPPPQVPVGSAKVSLPVQGAPPKGFCSMLASQRWHSCLWPPWPVRNSGSPTIMRKPYGVPSAVMDLRASKFSATVIHTGLNAVVLVLPS